MRAHPGGANAGAEERCCEGISQCMQLDGRASFVFPRYQIRFKTSQIWGVLSYFGMIFCLSREVKVGGK